MFQKVPQVLPDYESPDPKKKAEAEKQWDALANDIQKTLKLLAKKKFQGDQASKWQSKTKVEQNLRNISYSLFLNFFEKYSEISKSGSFRFFFYLMFQYFLPNTNLKRTQSKMENFVEGALFWGIPEVSNPRAFNAQVRKNCVRFRLTWYWLRSIKLGRFTSKKITIKGETHLSSKKISDD